MVKLEDQIALVCTVTFMSAWEKWHQHEFSRDTTQFIGKDLRQAVFQFRGVWDVPTPDEDSVSFAIGVHANEIRECMKSCGMDLRVETRSTTLVTIIEPTRASRSSFNHLNVQLSPEIVVVSEVASPPMQEIGTNLETSFRFMSLKHLRQVTIKELETLEQIAHTIDNGIETDTQCLTMPADGAIPEALVLDSRRKTN